MTTVNEKSSIEDKGSVDKPPENKPSAQERARIAFTWVMWVLSAIANAGRVAKMVRRFADWLREVFDDS